MDNMKYIKFVYNRLTTELLDKYNIPKSIEGLMTDINKITEEIFGHEISNLIEPQLLISSGEIVLLLSVKNEKDIKKLKKALKESDIKAKYVRLTTDKQYILL